MPKPAPRRRVGLEPVGAMQGPRDDLGGLLGSHVRAGDDRVDFDSEFPSSLGDAQHDLLAVSR